MTEVQIATESSISPKEMLRLEVLSSLESHTKVMFKAQYKRPFIVAKHHKRIFEALQDVVDGKCRRLMINMPPRYGKTETVVKSFISWGFGLNPKCKFLHLSYSDILVNDNSNTVRQIMLEPIYKELYPNSLLEKEKGSSTRWKTKKGGEMYAVSTQGQVTGFGAGLLDDPDEHGLTDDEKLKWREFNLELNSFLAELEILTEVFNGAIIIDDPMKPEDAMSDTLRERINKRFETTIRTRVNSRNTPIIIIMQRLHEHDLCGYLMETEPDEWRVLSLPAIEINEFGEQVPLWDLKHTIKELHKMRDIDSHTFDTQFMQDPKPLEGLMYQSGFGTYSPEQLPRGRDRVRAHTLNYTDTADTGADHLCSINFIDTPDFIYVIDVLFTNKPMEVTEPQTAEFLTLSSVQKAKIESNNGGRGFARNVSKLMRRTYKNYKTKVVTFTQSENKYVRIFTKSAEAQNMILFPVGWEKKWPLFHNALMSYRKDNRRRSQHDDAPDTLTGVVEMHGTGLTKTKAKRKN